MNLHLTTGRIRKLEFLSYLRFHLLLESSSFPLSSTYVVMFETFVNVLCVTISFFLVSTNLYPGISFLSFSPFRVVIIVFRFHLHKLWWFNWFIWFWASVVVVGFHIFQVSGFGASVVVVVSVGFNWFLAPGLGFCRCSCFSWFSARFLVSGFRRCSCFQLVLLLQLDFLESDCCSCCFPVFQLGFWFWSYVVVVSS